MRGLGVEVLPPRGFVTTAAEFEQWTGGKPLLERFYRGVRRRTGVLMDGAEPAGGRWNYDAENREPPPRGARTLGVPQPWWPEEDEVDAQVRADLAAVPTVGEDGPRRFAVTRGEALAALDVFLRDRLPGFGAHEDAMLAGDPWMAHSLLSVPLNLGLLDPMEVVLAAEGEFRAGRVPLAAAEGFIRQVLGWREYMWHLYWWLPDDYRTRNRLSAHPAAAAVVAGAGGGGGQLRGRDPARRCARPGGRTTSSGSWSWARGRCSAATTRPRSPTGSTGSSWTGTTG